MADTEVGLYSLNSGEVSALALARVDLAKLKMACQKQQNWLPHVLGPAMVRPGTQYITGTKSDTAGKFIEFYRDATTTALLVITPGIMRVLTSDAYLSRGTVTAAIANGDWPTNLTSWTDSDESGAVSDWIAGPYGPLTGPFMQLTGTGSNYAFRDQQVTVHQANAEHALRLVVAHGNVLLKVGLTQGGDDYWNVTLLPGTYSLAFNPSADFWIRLGANDAFPALVSSIAVEASGIVELPVPYQAGDLSNLFYDQSEDVIFVACKGFQQRRIEHRASAGAASTDVRSWGVALYLADDGPFLLANLGPTVLTPSAVSGSTTVTADRPLFKSSHVGSIWRLTQGAQSAKATLAGASQFTGAIRITGIGSARDFLIEVSGTFDATVVLQSSLGAPGAWTDVENVTVDTPVTTDFNDGLDNQVVYYRLGITTDYTSGSAVSQLNVAFGAQTAIFRITGVTDSTHATVDVLRQFGGSPGSSDWAEGAWSDLRGWPQCVGLHDGRLDWNAGIKLQGSVSDAFASFDDTVLGEAGPINRNIATGGSDGVRWLLSLQRLIAGTAAQEVSIRASALDDPLTNTAFTARACASRGVARIRALKVDQIGIYVGRDGKRVYKLVFEAGSIDYRSRELTRLKQEMCAAGIVDVAVQRQPDTRVWFVLADGTAAVLTYDEEDEVAAWIPFVTPGLVERVGVLPGTDEDQVYFIVNRTINSVSKRFVEKLAKRTECVGGLLSKTIDCHVVYSGGATTTVTAAHLPATQVVAWSTVGGVGQPQVTAAAPVTTDGSGVATLPGSVTGAVVGLAYTADLQTVKLAYAAERGAALSMPKRIAHAGLVMANVSWKGVRIGRDFSNLTGLAATYKGRPLTATEVLAAYDDIPSGFNGAWDPDSRVCVRVQSPHCCTLLGMVLHIETNEPNPPPPRNGG